MAATLLNRRRCLLGAAAAFAAPAWARAAAAPPPLLLAAAWDDAEGRHHVGVLAFARDPAGGPPQLRVRHALQVHTRAHAVWPCPDGSLLAVARRPGAWLLRWRPGSPAQAAQWRWSEADRSFNGHVLLQGPAGRAEALLCTETDAADGRGLLVRRDARTLEVLEEWPTGGIDPHALLALPEGGWLVANGGVPTRPESGRVKGNLSAMDSSIVHLDGQGRPRGAWRLADQRLSLRHLARRADGLVGVALQAEHDDEDERRRAPLIALWDGQRLRPGESAPLEGYAGDIIARPTGFLLGATRAGCVARFDLQGRLVARYPLASACALAPLGDTQGWLCAGGEHFGLGHDDGRAVAARTAGLRIDNHWARLSA